MAPTSHRGQGGGTRLLAPQPHSRTEGLPSPELQGHHHHNNPATVLTTQPQPHDGSHAATTPQWPQEGQQQRKTGHVRVRFPTCVLGRAQLSVRGHRWRPTLTLADDSLLVKKAQLFPAMQINQSVKTQEGTDTGLQTR